MKKLINSEPFRVGVFASGILFIFAMIVWKFLFIRAMTTYETGIFWIPTAILCIVCFFIPFFGELLGRTDKE